MISLTFTTKIVSSAAEDKKKSSDKCSLEVFPLKVAAVDFKPFPAVSPAATETADVALIPNRALVPPVPAVAAVASPLTIASLPISIFEAA